MVQEKRGRKGGRHLRQTAQAQGYGFYRAYFFLRCGVSAAKTAILRAVVRKCTSSRLS